MLLLMLLNDVSRLDRRFNDPLNMTRNDERDFRDAKYSDLFELSFSLENGTRRREDEVSNFYFPP